MSMIVARMQKMKADNLIGSGNHNQRKTENHSNKEINIDLSYLNYDLVDQTQNYKRDILKFINENKSSTRALRKDAVLVNEWIISSDRDFFDDLNENETRSFFKAAKDYFGEKFGDENIRYATVHLDETTPHMHMGVVPFDDDKKLSAKRVFDRQALRDVQEELPRYLQELGFEIERGREGSERKNLTVPEFKKMKEEEKEIERSIESKKDEFRSYLKDKSVKSSIDNIKAKKELKGVKIPSGEKFLGHEFTKTVEKETGNLIISEKDFKNIQDFNSYSKKNEANLLNLLDTDLYKENKSLKKELKEQKNKNYEDIEDYNKLVVRYNKLNKENVSLKSQVADFKKEIKLIYNSTKNFLKDRVSDIGPFKSMLKELVDSVSINSKNNSLDSNFKKEYDKENRIKRQRK